MTKTPRNGSPTSLPRWTRSVRERTSCAHTPTGHPLAGDGTEPRKGVAEFSAMCVRTQGLAMKRRTKNDRRLQTESSHGRMVGLTG